MATVSELARRKRQRDERRQANIDEAIANGWWQRAVYNMCLQAATNDGTPSLWRNYWPFMVKKINDEHSGDTPAITGLAAQKDGWREYSPFLNR